MLEDRRHALTSRLCPALQLYLSPEQTKALQGNNSQGPVYKVYEAIGPQAESKFQTAPASGFGTSTRSIKYSNPNPGPGACASSVIMHAKQ